MHTPRTTVYVTNHNYGRYLEQAIESVLSQTDQDFELLIIDDGSTDESRQILERYESREKVSVIYQQNRGLNVTNNIALKAARGRYLMRLDADDYLDPHALEVLATHLDKNPDVGLVFPDWYVVDEQGALLEVQRRHDFAQVTLLDQPAHGACTIIRRDCLLELGGYDEQFRCQDGYELWLRFTRRFKVSNVNLPLFYYRRHGNNLTQAEGRILDARAAILAKNADQAPRIRTLAIVPVRGTASDPHSEVLRPLGSKRLIDWTLQPALASSAVCDVLVTTPDEAVLDYVTHRYGDHVITVRRDPKLARQNTRLEDSLFHALEQYGVGRPPPDALMTLFVESPFRTPDMLNTAVDVMRLFGTDSVVSVRQEPGIFYKHNGSGLVPVVPLDIVRLEREDLYREAAQIYLTRLDELQRTRRLIGGKIGHFIVRTEAAFRLRAEHDWAVAEYQAARKEWAAEPRRETANGVQS